MHKLSKSFIFYILIISLAISIAISLYVMNEHQKTMVALEKKYSTTELVIQEKYMLDIDDLYKYENLSLLDIHEIKINKDEFEALSIAFPKCQILWTVPLKSAVYDGSFASDVLTLSLPSITKEDFPLLSYFSNLEQIEVCTVSCYDDLIDFQNSNTDINCLWKVKIGEQEFSNKRDSITCPASSLFELFDKLKYMPNVKNVDLTGNTPEPHKLVSLINTYPYTKFNFKMDVCGIEFDSDSVNMDLKNNLNIDLTEIEERLVCFKNLENVDLRECAVDNDLMLDLCELHPNVIFDWTFSLYEQTITTVDEVIDLSGIKLSGIEQIQQIVPYMHELKRVDMRNCGLNNETMDVLFTSFPDIKFVWNIKVGSHVIPTDVQCFSMKNYSKAASNASEFVRIYDCEVLKYCTDLIALDLGHNYIEDISPLAGLKKMRVLILADNCITDISALAGMEELEYFEFFMNDVTDISVLGELTNLIDINCVRNSISDASPLYNCKKLDRVWISMNNLSEDQKQLLKENLSDCTFNFTVWSSTDGGWREVDRFFWVRGLFKSYYLNE